MTTVRMSPELARWLGCAKRVQATASRLVLRCITLNEGEHSIIVHATDGSVWVWPILLPKPTPPQMWLPG